MSSFKKYLLLASLIYLAISCGAQIDTGRNGDPSQWPKVDGNSPESHDPKGPGENNPGHDPETGEPSPEAPSPGGGRGGVSACFQTGTHSINAELTQFCQEQIRPVSQFSEIYKIVCEQGKILAVLNQSHCGWDGSTQTISRYMHTYYMQQDSTKDYEDIIAGFSKAPVSVAKYIYPIRLAFENYDEFKSKGFIWVAGTREHTNLNKKTWERGIQYRFRADKGTYEIGYEGFNQVHQISPTLWIHLNYATGDFERISHFAQIAFHQQQSDNSTLSFRIEHRKISSQGFYERAKKSAAELAKDVMEKGYRNAIK